MLVLSRKSKESVQIGGVVVVTVLSIRGNTVRLGIDAPMMIPVIRTELNGRDSDASGKRAGTTAAPATPFDSEPCQ